MLFRVCSDNRLFPEAVRVFDYVEEKGFVIEERSCFVLLLALKRCGEIELCLRFFRRMVESNGIEIRVQSLTLVIDGLCKRGEVEKAKELMDEMVTKSIVKPTVFTYNTLLNAYVGRKDRSGVGEILRLMEKEPVVFSVATYSILIQWYSSSGDIGEVEKIFEEMRERKIEIDVYVYSSMISWNCRLGNMKRAFALFDEMAQRNVAPNAHTYGALIGGVCKAGQMEAAEILLEEMQSKGIDLNMIIFNTMIDGYCKRGMMDEALRLQTIMERKGFNADVFTFNILANGLCKLHRYDEAKCTLNSMVEKGVEPNVVTFTMFIEIYCKEGNLAEAERFFRDMEKKGEVPNIVTYNTLIDVYCKKEKVKLAHLTKSEIIISIVWFYTEHILVFLHQSQDIARTAALYMKFLIPGLFAFSILQNILRFLQTQSVVMPLVYLSAIPALIHVGIAYGFVEWIGLNFIGGPIATSVSMWIIMILLGSYVMYAKKFENTWTGFSMQSFHYLITSMKLALPSAAMVCLEYWAFEIMVFLAGLLPNSQITTSLIAIWYASYTLTFFTRVSNELGAGRPERAKHAMRVSLKLSLLLGLGFVLLLVFGHDIWIQLFSNSPVIKEEFASITPLLAISILLDSVQGVLSGVARGSGWQHLAVYVNLATFYLIGLPISCLLGFKTNLQYKGLWIGLICGLVCQTGTLLVLTWRVKWTKLNLSVDKVKDQPLIA
ncbi:hypothetical protein RYX36_005407 [Vicia faba]